MNIPKNAIEVLAQAVSAAAIAKLREWGFDAQGNRVEEKPKALTADEVRVIRSLVKELRRVNDVVDGMPKVSHGLLHNADAILKRLEAGR